ncbi:MAG: thioredoxin domain-containing protein [Minicystis sp.]
MLLSFLRKGSLLALACLAGCAGAPVRAPGETATAASTEGPAASAPRSKGGQGAASAGDDKGEGEAMGGEREAMLAGAPGSAPMGAPAGAPMARARGLGGVEIAGGGADHGELGPVPVTAADPSWGERNAPVTLVVFSDLQCPFCARAAETVEQLKKDYGPGKLRVVWKNNPLSFHKDARFAAETAMALFERSGPAAFWAYTDAVLQGSTATRFTDAIRPSGLSAGEVAKIVEKGAVGRKIEADLELGRRLGVTGTPAFFINGVSLRGAQPIEEFKTLIDAELKKAKALGVSDERVYVEAARKNFTAPKADPSSADEDTAIHRVPVGNAPVKGKATALVTLVVFADFQCPFCIQVEPALAQIEQSYGDKLRIVWKNTPLPFHGRAEPAAELALEARAQKGDAGFWKAHDLLVAQAGKLEASDLEGVAKAAGLDLAKVTRALDTHAYRVAIEEDQDLAQEIGASGTPSFFINGRMLVGAQPVEKFKALIDEQLVVAQAAIAKGTAPAKLYETLQQGAKGPEPMERLTLPAPTKENPSRGPENAKVTVNVFGDFQCTFCERAEGTLKELDAAFPGALRFVWHNLPLQMHPYAQQAAEAAVEAFAQKGNAGFWAMHAKLFQGSTQPNGLERRALDGHAAAVGLDLAKFAAALDGRTHRAAVEAEIKSAEKAGVSGTPGFVINGYYISGAMPLPLFRRTVRRALAEAK